MTTNSLTNKRTRQEWAEMIKAEWDAANQHAKQAVVHAMNTGQMLIDAREQQGDEGYGEIIQKAGISGAKARQLRRLVRRPIGEQWRAAPNILPNTWATLYELSQLDVSALEDAEKRGLIGPDTGFREARAIAGAYTKPEGEVIGDGRKPDHLPTPAEANRIARETGRLVAANDGNLYSGASDEESADHIRRRQQTYGVRDAIDTIAQLDVTPEQWLAETESHWIHDLALVDIEAASRWLNDLTTALQSKSRIIDA